MIRQGWNYDNGKEMSKGFMWLEYLKLMGIITLHLMWQEKKNNNAGWGKFMMIRKL